jgi:PAS domain-containing protein
VLRSANTNYKVEYRVLGIEDSIERWIRTQRRAYGPGEPRVFIGAVLDITEQKRIEQTLRESEARVEAAARLLNLGRYSWNPQNK